MECRFWRVNNCYKFKLLKCVCHSVRATLGTQLRLRLSSLHDHSITARPINLRHKTASKSRPLPTSQLPTHAPFPNFSRITLHFDIPTTMLLAARGWAGWHSYVPHVKF